MTLAFSDTGRDYTQVLTMWVTLPACFSEGTIMVKELLQSNKRHADAEISAGIARDTNPRSGTQSVRNERDSLGEDAL